MILRVADHAPENIRDLLHFEDLERRREVRRCLC